MLAGVVLKTMVMLRPSSQPQPDFRSEGTTAMGATFLPMPTLPVIWRASLANPVKLLSTMAVGMRTFLPPTMARVAAMRYLARLLTSPHMTCRNLVTCSSVKSAPCSLRILLSSSASSSLVISAAKIPVPSTSLQLLSTIQEAPTNIGKNKKVNTPSPTSTTCGVRQRRMINNHTYAKIENAAVTAYTPKSLIFRTWPSGITKTQTAMMTNILKAALPTIVDGPSGTLPSGPLKKLSRKFSKTLIKISGALEPKAIKVRLATVAFQTVTVTNRCFSSDQIRDFLDVIFSMATMKTSAMIATPMKHQPSSNKYIMMRNGLTVCSPPHLRSMPSSHTSSSTIAAPNFH
mmetsp:Transcript_89713/g.257034  ORF Transcript_89713/g.257034 Transcript_89713/m.257034 type:complete len:346 (+) Transcript_89713:188-1225(+)